jgi:DNA polymerase I
MTTKPTILLIDSHALIHRAYHAVPPRLSTKQGVQVNAVFGFTRILFEVLERFNPKYVVCAFDSKGPTFRHEYFKEYKATRKKPDQELIDQIPIVKEIVNSLNIPLVELSGYEADDILGTLSKHPEAKELHKIIVTGDQDLLQMVSEDISVYIGGGFWKS